MDLLEVYLFLLQHNVFFKDRPGCPAPFNNIWPHVTISFFDDNFFLLAHQAGCPASPRPNAFSTFLPPTRTSPEGSEGGFVNLLRHGFDQRLNSGIVINDLTDQTCLSKVILYTQHTAPQTYVTRCELTLKRAFSNFFENNSFGPWFWQQTPTRSFHCLPWE